MRQAIVIASFGCLDALEADFRAEFPEAVIVQAFTSTFIRTSLEKRGLHVDSLEEALLRLSEEDVTHVLVQPTYMTPGEEYEKKVLDVVPAYTSRYEKLTVGEPAFFEEADYTRNLIALCRSIFVPRDAELVLLGHGSPHRHNPVYERLQAEIDAQQLPIHVGVLESTDTPDFKMVLERLQKRQVREVLLAPLLLTSGMHVARDMAGEGEARRARRIAALPPDLHREGAKGAAHRVPAGCLCLSRITSPRRPLSRSPGWGCLFLNQSHCVAVKRQLTVIL